MYQNKYNNLIIYKLHDYRDNMKKFISKYINNNTHNI